MTLDGYRAAQAVKWGDPAVFDATVRKMADVMEGILEKEPPEDRARLLELLKNTDREELLEYFNRTRPEHELTPYDVEASEEAVRRHVIPEMTSR